MSAGTEKPKPNFTLDRLRELLFPEKRELYDGSEAYTLAELTSRWPDTGRTTLERHAGVQIEAGTLVEVNVIRRDRLGRRSVRKAYVLKEVYDQWQQDRNIPNLSQTE